MKGPILGSDSLEYQVWACHSVTRWRPHESSVIFLHLLDSFLQRESCATWVNAFCIDEIRAIGEDVEYRVSSMIIGDPGTLRPLSSAKSFTPIVAINLCKLRVKSEESLTCDNSLSSRRCEKWKDNFRRHAHPREEKTIYKNSISSKSSQMIFKSKLERVKFNSQIIYKNSKYSRKI